MALSFSAAEIFKVEFLTWWNRRIVEDHAGGQTVDVSELSAKWALDVALWPRHHVPLLLLDVGYVEWVEFFAKERADCVPTGGQPWRHFTSWLSFNELCEAVKSRLDHAIALGTLPSPAAMFFLGRRVPACEADAILTWARESGVDYPILRLLPAIHTEIDGPAARAKRITLRVEEVRRTGVRNFRAVVAGEEKISVTRIGQLIARQKKASLDSPPIEKAAGIAPNKKSR